MNGECEVHGKKCIHARLQDEDTGRGLSRSAFRDRLVTKPDAEIEAELTRFERVTDRVPARAPV